MRINLSRLALDSLHLSPDLRCLVALLLPHLPVVLEPVDLDLELGLALEEKRVLLLEAPLLAEEVLTHEGLEGAFGECNVAIPGEG